MDTVLNGVGNAGSRKTVRTATSTAAKNFAKKAAKKGVEKAFEASSEYALNKIDSLGNTAINRKNSGTDSLGSSQKKKKRNIKRHSLHSPSLRRKLKFVDNDDDCCTSPIII